MTSSPGRTLACSCLRPVSDLRMVSTWQSSRTFRRNTDTCGVSSSNMAGLATESTQEGIDHWPTSPLILLVAR